MCNSPISVAVDKQFLSFVFIMFAAEKVFSTVVLECGKHKNVCILAPNSVFFFLHNLQKSVEIVISVDLATTLVMYDRYTPVFLDRPNWSAG